MSARAADGPLGEAGGWSLPPASDPEAKPDLETIAEGRRERWEQEWEVERQRPEGQLANTIPAELISAVHERWFIPGSRILDIGSGRGHISAALAQRGFTVVGADLAEAATQLAWRDFGHLDPHLTFRTLDICMDPPEPERFDAFLDRGCFHGLWRRPQQQYVENVFTWGKPGARLLLFHKVAQEGQTDANMLTPQQLVEHIRRTFEPWFDIDKADLTLEPLERSAGPLPRRRLPGMVFRMSRRAVRPQLINRSRSTAGTVTNKKQLQTTGEPRLDTIPSAIRNMVQSNWWHRGMRLLDIGCGEGMIAAWFAKEGLDVLGVDAAPEHIAQARKSFCTTERLNFEIMDVRRPMAFERPFDALVDLGCLARLAVADRPAYLSNVAAAANPGARFLLLLPAPAETHKQQFVRNVRRLFELSFESIDTRITPFLHPRTGLVIRSVAFRFVRR